MSARVLVRMVAFGLLLCFAAPVGAALGAEADGDRPNLLLIFTDDQSHRSVGCYPEAHPWVKTPNIDRLADEGVRFENAYMGTWCMASRATLLTGLHPHGVKSMRMQGPYPGSVYDPGQCRFWPANLRRAGYATGMIGKWHTGRDTAYGRAWDYQAVWNHVDPKRYGGYYTGQSISFNGGLPTKVGGYSTDNYTRWAVEFVRGEHRPANKPWYLWLCYDGVHSPYREAARHRGDYGDASPVPVPKDIYPPRPTKPRYMHRYGKWKADDAGRPAMKGRSLDAFVQQYNRTVRAIDEGVGQLLAALKETGQLDNTLVVYTSDQGFAWGQHGFAWKYAPYEANLRCPLLVRLPGRVAEGRVCRHPVGGVDLVPTLLAMAGVEPPWEMHGHDFSSLLANPEADWPHPVLIEQTGRRYGADTRTIPSGEMSRHGGVPWYAFLRDGRYKYIRTFESDEIEELYDLQSDAEELENLAYDEAHRARLKEFRTRLVAELNRTGAPFVGHLPEPRKAKPKVGASTD